VFWLNKKVAWKHCFGNHLQVFDGVYEMLKGFSKRTKKAISESYACARLVTPKIWSSLECSQGRHQEKHHFVGRNCSYNIYVLQAVYLFFCV
jgi:hypothetical protein